MKPVDQPSQSEQPTAADSKRRFTFQRFEIGECRERMHIGWRK